VIVGSGPGRDTYRQLAALHYASPYVQFIDWMPRQELISLYRHASAFLFPSHEGAGMVVSEALSFGLPVICLDNAGPGEFINPACGIGVKAGTREETIDALAKAIGQLYHNTPLRKQMGEAARQRFETTFHWNRRGEALHRIYETL
jgi:glycosyltransferase involved in cell wall biosynthesis